MPGIVVESEAKMIQLKLLQFTQSLRIPSPNPCKCVAAIDSCMDSMTTAAPRVTPSRRRARDSVSTVSAGGTRTGRPPARPPGRRVKDSPRCPRGARRRSTHTMLPSLLTPAREAFCLAAAGLAPAAARTHAALDVDLKLVHVQNQLQTRKPPPPGRALTRKAQPTWMPLPRNRCCTSRPNCSRALQTKASRRAPRCSRPALTPTRAAS